MLGHEVHRKADVGANAAGQIDLIAPFTVETGIPVTWITLSNPDNYTKLMLECSSAEATINIGHVLVNWASPKIANLFENLNPWLVKAPIEDFNDFIPSTLAPFTFGGKLYAIPIRVSGSTFMYHKGYFEQKGVSPPSTIEEFGVVC
jgi:ABC-type glycerol-3-phosphate transport system substrate-binding protein